MRVCRDLWSFIERGWGLITYRSSENYWIKRYRSGGNSGSGSYGESARFKAGVLNEFVKKNHIHTVIEFGCGDGNQLKLAKYPSYVGYDISPEAIARCKAIFKDDATKSFYLMSNYTGEKADLTLSLDVIYHLVEDDVFDRYITLLFHSSQKFTIIYSTNTDQNKLKGPHIRNRHVSEWVKANQPAWKLIDQISGSLVSDYVAKEVTGAEFFVYQWIDRPGAGKS